MKDNELRLISVETEEKKLNWKKVFLVASIFIIIIFSIYLLFNIDNGEEKNQEEQIAQQTEQQEESVQEEQPVVVEIPQKKTPIYSENAKIEMENIYKSETKRVFLTFDDGPSNNVTPLILDTLKANDVKATFFVLGSRVELYPEILNREYDEGHYIANHGYSHKYSSIYATEENVVGEYMQTEECIRNALEIPEYSSHLFRFPGGSTGGKYANLKKRAIQLLDENEVAHVDWNALSKDAEGSFDKHELYNNLVQTAQNKNSVVVLMHDAGGKMSTAEALQSIIDYFREEGYEFKNFYDIMQ